MILFLTFSLAFLYIFVIKPELQRRKYVVDTIKYIKENKSLYTRIWSSLVKLLIEKEVHIDFDSKSLFLEWDGSVFTVYEKWVYWLTYSKKLRKEAEELVNNFKDIWKQHWSE